MSLTDEIFEIYIFAVCLSYKARRLCIFKKITERNLFPDR
jgi:hypothetical protein